jgi:hypothetical protein
MKTLFKILYKALVLEICTVLVLMFIGIVATLCFAIGIITVTTLQLMVSIIAVNLIILFVIFVALFTVDLSTQENLWK